MDISVPQTIIYVPSTTEKKRAIACFIFMGIVMSLVSQKSFSPYEYYYLSSSIGWRMIGGFVLLVLLVTLVLPVFLLLSLPLFLAWVVVGVLLVTAAWKGSYDNSSPLFRFLQGMGSWMLNLFDVQVQSVDVSSS